MITEGASVPSALLVKAQNNWMYEEAFITQSTF